MDKRSQHKQQHTATSSATGGNGAVHGTMPLAMGNGGGNGNSNSNSNSNNNFDIDGHYAQHNYHHYHHSTATANREIQSTMYAHGHAVGPATSRATTTASTTSHTQYQHTITAKQHVTSSATTTSLPKSKKIVSHRQTAGSAVNVVSTRNSVVTNMMGELPRPPSVNSGVAVLSQMQKSNTKHNSYDQNLMHSHQHGHSHRSNLNTNSYTNTNASGVTKSATVVDNSNTELADKVMRFTRRTAMKELTALHAKSIAAQDRNEEALRDLETRMPEVSKIFDVEGRIGSGTFSTVLLATLKRERNLPEYERRKFAIKHHNPTNHPERIIRELECMFKIGGTQNIIGINCCIRYNDSIAFIMPYMSHDRFHDIFRSLTLTEVRDYMRQLLVALRHVHKFNVIHRDVKPSNILYNRRSRQFLLCDFGLAQRIAPDGTVITSTDFSEALSENGRNASSKSALKVHSQTRNAGKEHREGDSSAKRTRAAGGGVNSTIMITANGTSYMGEATGIPPTPLPPPCNTYTYEDRRPHTNSKNITPSPPLKQRDIAFQKADTVRLMNRLRQVSSSVDINNYVVSTNTSKKEIHASRAGTPGYRPPEVLLRYPYQTTAVDIWAAGVILLTIMSTLHPFFKAPNDCNALSEIINLFGDLSIRKTAFLLDRLVMLSQKVAPLDLRRVCMRFRHNDAFTSPEMMRRFRRGDGTCDICHNCEQYYFNCLCKNTSFKIETYDSLDVFPQSAYDLLNRLLEIKPERRITADEALNHPFFNEIRTYKVPVQPRQGNKDSKSTCSLTRTMKPYAVYTVPATTTIPNPEQVALAIKPNYEPI